jgi:thioredoxin 1
MAEVILTEQSFEQEVLKSTIPVLVDFWAPWCGPCRIQGPIIEELAQVTDPVKAKVGKLNVDEHGGIAQTYGIMSIPTLAIFKGGQVVEQFVGVQQKDKLVEALQKHSV